MANYVDIGDYRYSCYYDPPGQGASESEVLDWLVANEVNEYPAKVTLLNRTKSSYGLIQSTVTINNQTYNVKIVDQLFKGCTSLTAAPVIPRSIVQMDECFYGCTSLTGSVIINAANIYDTHWADAFKGTTKGIWLRGSSSKLNEIAATANNGNVFVGQIPLNYAMDIKRVSSDGSTTESEGNYALVHVGLSWSVFAQNNIDSIVLKDGNTTKTVTWYTDTGKTSPVSLPDWHPAATVDIYCWVAIDENAHSFSVVVSDEYHSGQTITFVVPAVFKLVNFRPGGKGIAFGQKATEDNFTVNMDVKLLKETKLGLNYTGTPGSATGTDADLVNALSALGWTDCIE